MAPYHLTRQPGGGSCVAVPYLGTALLAQPFNKGSAFTAEERAAFGLEGPLAVGLQYHRTAGVPRQMQFHAGDGPGKRGGIRRSVGIMITLAPHTPPRLAGSPRQHWGIVASARSGLRLVGPRPMCSP
jgi:hypothetical protein